MADIEITVDGGTSKRLLTAGKYCDKNILVTATGGGGEPVPPDDGKTRLYITIPANAMPDRPPPRNKVPLCIQQTVANGVTIDWGDGTAPETLSGTGKVNTTHTYEQAGDYVISLEPEEGCELGLGTDGSSNNVLGGTSQGKRAYGNMLQKVYIGKNVSNIGNYAFYYCCSLASVVIPSKVANIGNYAFGNCYSLAFLVTPNGIVSIGKNAFVNGSSLVSIAVPNGVESVGSDAFSSCYEIKEYHFLSAAPPALGNTGVFYGIPSDCIIYVPKGSAEAYKTATNWTTVADHIQEEPA